MRQFSTLGLLARLRSLPILVGLMLFGIAAGAQTINLSGNVSDESGTGLPGVTIRLEGTGLGTISDNDGGYKIMGRAPKGTWQLTFSFTGFNTVLETVTITGDLTETRNATLTDGALNLDEIVVTGSTLKSSRRQLGNSTYSIGEKDLQNSGTGGLLTALQGKVPGARITQTSGDPAGGINVQLRGINSLRGGNDPLYIIDGVVMSNGTTTVGQISVDGGSATVGTNRLADINPADIESMNIINGAAAAAIYGSRASNGVVLITTKKGSQGKPEITVGTSLSLNQLRKKVYISTYGKQFGATDLRLHTIGVAPAALPETDKITVLGRKLATNLVDVTRFDYQDAVFGDAMGTDNFVSVRGGKENTKYYASFGYLNNGGIVKNTDFTRYSMRMNLDQTLSIWAKMGVGVSYANSFANEKPNGNSFYSPVNTINITNNTTDINIRDANGNLKAVEPTRVNPLSVIEDFDITTAVNRVSGSANLTVFPLENLTIDFIAGIDAFSALGKTFIPRYKYGGVNAAYYRDGYAATVSNLSFLYNNDLNATYARTFGKIASTTTVGFNYQYSQFDAQQSTGQNLAPVISTVNGAATVGTAYGLDRFGMSGFFGQETVGYDNWIYLTLAGRVDGSTKFSPDENNQFYPKASLSVVASELWKDKSLAKTLNGLRLRASFGEAGGVSAIGSYDRFWQFSPVQYLGKNTILPGSAFANPLVVPERTREIEAGFDLSILNNMATIGFTAYKQNVFDLIVNRLLAPSSGGASIVNNVGELENKGIELSLGLRPIHTKTIDWNLWGIFSKNKNLVVNAGSPTVGIVTVSGAPIFFVQGEAASVFYGTFAATNADGSEISLPGLPGLPQVERGTSVNYNGTDPIPDGSYVVAGKLNTPKRDANGQPTGDILRRVIGDPNPDYTISFGNSLTWKGLTLGFLFDGAYGQDVFNADRRTRQGVGIGDYAEKELKGELPRGYIWSIYPIEEWRIDDGSYLKLRELSLGYNFGKCGVFNGVTLSVVGRNLQSWDNYDGYDPETNAGGTNDFLRGVDFGNVPIPRTIQGSLTARF